MREWNSTIKGRMYPTGATDRIGKVFKVEQEMRRCLVCEELFTPRAAAKHADVACIFKMKVWSHYGCQTERDS